MIGAFSNRSFYLFKHILKFVLLSAYLVACSKMYSFNWRTEICSGGSGWNFWI